MSKRHKTSPNISMILYSKYITLTNIIKLELVSSSWKDDTESYYKTLKYISLTQKYSKLLIRSLISCKILLLKNIDYIKISHMINLRTLVITECHFNTLCYCPQLQDISIFGQTNLISDMYSKIPNVQSITFCSSDVKINTFPLDQIQNLKYLKILHLIKIDVDMNIINQIKTLEKLYLIRCNTTNDFIKNINLKIIQFQ